MEYLNFSSGTLRWDDDEVPDLFRKAIVVPEHKSGKKELAVNKRSVSLSSVSCKVVERMVCPEVY